MNRFESIFPALPMFAFTEGEHWTLGIGDPTFMGWFTVAAYAIAAFLCWRASKQSAYQPRLRFFWMGLAGVLLALGINKQLDLQTALTFIGKDFAKSTGWYENRRIVQGLFIVVIGLLGLAGTAALFLFYRRDLRQLWMALAGLGFLGIFIVARAASFHHVDQILNFAPGGVRMNWILELGGIAAIAWPAWRVKKPLPANADHVWVSGAQGPAQRKRVSVEIT